MRCFALIGLVAGIAHGATSVAYSAGAGGEVKVLPAQLASFDNQSGVPAVTAAQRRTLRAKRGFNGCAAGTIKPPPMPAGASSSGYTLLVERGGCPYAEKWATAEAEAAAADDTSAGSGAAVRDLTLLVRNTRAALWGDINATVTSSAGRAVDAYKNGACPPPPRTATYDCQAAETWVALAVTPAQQRAAPWVVADDDAGTCARAEACASSQCIATGAARVATAGTQLQQQLCCMWDVLVYMGGENKSLPAVRAAFVSVASGEALLNASLNASGAAGGAALMAAVASTGDVAGDGAISLDPASLLLWALGVCVALGGTYAAAAEERAAYLAQGGTDLAIAAGLRGLWGKLPKGPPCFGLCGGGGGSGGEALRCVRHGARRRAAGGGAPGGGAE